MSAPCASLALLLQTAEIAWMKPGALLINAARGTVVDIGALAEAPLPAG